MPAFAVADAEVHYLERGTGDPLVLAHGFAGTGEASWASVLPALAERYRVLAPDARGHGRTTGGPEMMGHARAAADLVALLDHLGLERAHFVGHSGGGLSLLVLGTRHRARARTLTVIGSNPTAAEAGRAQVRALPDRWPAQPGWIDEQRRRHDATHGTDYWRKLLDALLAWADDPHPLPFQPAELAAITCPTLLLYGDRDPISPVETVTALYRALPNAELAIVPSATHGPHAERPELFVRLLADFHARHADA
jgi:pimeloyl-ACP methyl ester carboxylesterase